MKRIFLLTGSRTGSHYLSTLFNSGLDAFHMPEIINATHWPNKKEYINKACLKNKLSLKYTKDNIFQILQNENRFIVKYYLGDDYKKISPQDILEFSKNNNVEFYFLYRKNNIDSLISFLYLHYQGKPTVDRLKKAANLVKYNNFKITETYNIFQPYIKNIITYEELNFTEKDLKLLDVNDITHPVSITKKQVKDKETMLKKDLAVYLNEREFVFKTYGSVTNN
jgi:hypothetical protein